MIRPRDTPLTARPGLRTEAPETNALARALGQLARSHSLRGCVLISFTEYWVGVNSSGEGDFARYMEQLGDRLLSAIDDGEFDPIRLEKPAPRKRKEPAP
jgi:hypothetical protein